MSQFACTTQGACSSNTTQTMLEVKPASGQGFFLKQWECFFDGSALAAGIRVQLIRTTTDGTGAGSPPTARPKDESFAQASNMTILHKLSAEGSLDYVLLDRYIDQVTGFSEQIPLGDEYKCKPGGDRLCIRIITPSGVTPNFTCAMAWEE